MHLNGTAERQKNCENLCNFAGFYHLIVLKVSIGYRISDDCMDFQLLGSWVERFHGS